MYKINAKTGDIKVARNIHLPFLSVDTKDKDPSRKDVNGCTDITPFIGSTVGLSNSKKLLNFR